MEQSVVEMPKAEYFEQALRRELGEERARDVIRKAGERYRSLYAERKQYDNRMLRKHLDRGLLATFLVWRGLAPLLLRRVVSLRRLRLVGLDVWLALFAFQPVVLVL